MATTSNSYTGNGSTVLFSFTFPYLDTTAIKVSLNGVDTTAYTLANATTIQFNTAPASGVAIKIYRVTSADKTEAEFYPGSAIRSTDLNRNFLQTLYVTQETQEVVASSSSAGLQTQITAANNTANTAIATANSANATANGIAGTANTALANSSSAVTTAGTALSTANAASATANAISSVATSAQTTANAAQATANAAQSTANSAFVPAGAVNYFAMSAVPTGYLKANGAAINRTTYAALFTAIGTIFGAGNGSTTFNLPDLRGEFARGWDDSRGVDTSRTFGSFQDHSFASHTHGINDPGHLHQITTYNGGGGGFVEGAVGAAVEGYTTTGAAVTGISIQATGGTETRPRNIALLACIKY